MLFCSSAPQSAHWIADALAGDKSLEFSVLKGEAPNPNLLRRSPGRFRSLTWSALLARWRSAALVGSSSEAFAGAPEATRERVALRCLQEVSSVIAAGGEAAATARVLRVDGGARSCEDVLFRLIREVRGSYAGVRTPAIHIHLPIFVR